MEKINKEVRQQQKTSQTISEERLKLINRVFMMISESYPGKFLKGMDEGARDRQRVLWASQLRKWSNKQITDASMRCTDYHPSFPPTIGEFKDVIRILNRKPDVPPVVPRSHRIGDIEDDRHHARQATIRAYNKRINSLIGFPISYKGEFDYQAVADSVDVPESPDDSNRCWGLLFEAFDKAWSEK